MHFENLHNSVLWDKDDQKFLTAWAHKNNRNDKEQNDPIEENKFIADLRCLASSQGNGGQFRLSSFGNQNIG